MRIWGYGRTRNKLRIGCASNEPQDEQEQIMSGVGLGFRGLELIGFRGLGFKSLTLGF